MNKLLFLSIISLIFTNGYSSQSNGSSSNTRASVGSSNKKAGSMETKRHAAVSKIAYLNIQKIMSVDARALPGVSKEWQDLYSNIEKVIDPANKEIETLKGNFESGKTEFEALQNSKLTSRDALQKKYEEVGKLELELRSRLEEREMFLQEELAKAQSIITPKVQKIVTRIKDEQGWDFVIRGELVLIENERFDITSDVLKILDKEYLDQKAAEEKELKAHKNNKSTVA